jgi:hypothetical protein
MVVPHGGRLDDMVVYADNDEVIEVHGTLPVVARFRPLPVNPGISDAASLLGPRAKAVQRFLHQVT